MGPCVERPVGRAAKACTAALVLALFLVVMLAYLPAIRGGFVWDDDRYVTKNHLLREQGGLRKIWFSMESPSQYFPLTYTFFRLEYALWGLDPLGYHLVNVIIHCVNSLLLFLVLRHLPVAGAWLAAGIFALHPVHVESVAWVSELKNVLSTMFYLLAVLSWLAFIGGEDRGKRRWYAHTLTMFAAALLSKTTAVTLPLVLLLILWLKSKRIDRSRIIQVVPFAVLSLAMGLLTIWWERVHQGTEGSMFALPFPEDVLVASRALWFYVSKLIWPSGMAFSYQRWEIDAGQFIHYFWLAACVLVAAGLWYRRRSLGRGPAAAILFFGASLAPLLGFIPLYTFRYTFAADHYQYVASMGMIALFSAVLAKGFCLVFDRRWPLMSVATVILLVLGSLTWRQAHAYRNQETLWRHTISLNPSSWMAHNNLGLYLEQAGDFDGAMTNYRKALSLNPDIAETHVNVGNALNREGRKDEALAHYRRAIDIDPEYPRAHYNSALSLADLGLFDEAAEHYRRAIDLLPGWAEARNNLGLILMSQGMAEEAVSHLREASRLKPQSVEIHRNLGSALTALGLFEEAVQHLRMSISINPDSAQVHNSLGAVLAAGGEHVQATYHFREAIRIEPDSAGAHFNLGLVMMYEERWSEAAELFRQALKIDPDYRLAREKLSEAEAGSASKHNSRTDPPDER